MLQMFIIISTLILLMLFGAGGFDGFVRLAKLEDWKNSCRALIKEIEQKPIISGIRLNPSPKNVADLKEQLQHLEAKISDLVTLIKAAGGSVRPPVNFYTIFNKLKRRMTNPIGTAIAYCDQMQKGTDIFGQKANQKYEEGILPKMVHIIQGLPIEFDTLVTEISLDPLDKYVDVECSGGNDQLASIELLGEVSQIIEKIAKEIDGGKNSYFNGAPFERALALLLHLKRERQILGEESAMNGGQKVRGKRRHSMDGAKMSRDKTCQILMEMLLEAKGQAFRREMTTKISGIAELPIKGDQLMQLIDTFNWEWREISARIDRWVPMDGEREKYRRKLVEASVAAYETAKPLRLAMVSALDRLNAEAKAEMKRLEEQLHRLLEQRAQIGARAKDTLAKLSMDLQTDIGLSRQIVNAQIGVPMDELRMSNGAEQSALGYHGVQNAIYAAREKVQSAFQVPHSAYRWSIAVDEQKASAK